jgi:REP element-mobilizing transposase RayT
MAEQEKWKWQEPGTTWKGIGLYHITLTITDRQPLLGTLAITNNDPTMAKVVRTPLGNALIDCLLSIPHHHPEVQVLHFCLMPDHLHAVLYVRHTMSTGIAALVRGFWQATKRLGRAYSVLSTTAASSSIAPNAILRENQEEPNARPSLREATDRLKAFSDTLRKQMGDEAYYQLPPVFSEMPFIRPMSHNTQLPNTIRYIDMNPQRLATKHLKPGFFRVQRNIAIGERKYDGVGNSTILLGEHFEPVHVRQKMVKAAELGNNTALRDYMNSCVLKARKGVVMVSPFISTQEKQVMQVLLREQLPFILLADNGFRDYYKPSDILFDACASGRVLILSPWPYDANKRHISRGDCIALNAMAEEICNHLSL